MLLVRMRSYRKSVLGHKFSILDSYHPDILRVYLSEHSCGDPLLFFKAKRGSRAKALGNTAVGKYLGSNLKEATTGFSNVSFSSLFRLIQQIDCASCQSIEMSAK